MQQGNTLPPRMDSVSLEELNKAYQGLPNREIIRRVQNKNLCLDILGGCQAYLQGSIMKVANSEIWHPLETHGNHRAQSLSKHFFHYLYIYN